MEGAPLNPDTKVEKPVDKSESKDSTKKKKRFGVLAVESGPRDEKKQSPKAERKGESDKPKSLFEQFQQQQDKRELEKKVSEAKETAPAEVEPASEVVAPTEKLSAEEAHDVKRLIVQEARSEEAALPAEAPEDQVLAAKLVDRYHEKLAEGDIDDEAAFTETLAEAGATAEELAAMQAELAAEQPPEAEVAETDDTDDEQPDNAEEAPDESIEGSEVAPGDEEVPETESTEAEDGEQLDEIESDVIDPHSEAAPNAVPETADAEDDPDAPTAATIPPPPPTPPTPPTANGGATPPGGGGLPPIMPFPMPGAGGPHTSQFNAAPVAAEQAYDPNANIDDGNPAAAALLGGIIGYLIGRRRGRIKTEKKLLPIQKKLRKEVENLHWEVKAKESKLRKVAAQQVQQHGPRVIERFNQTVQEKPVEKPVEKVVTHTKVLEGQPSQNVEQTRDAAQPTERVLRAEQLHAQPRAPERIGHVLVAAGGVAELAKRNQAEVSSPKVPEQQVANAEKPETEKLIPEKRIETLNRAELLHMSENIIVEGSSLRQIYETHLIGEKGLRRLVAEHLRGGDLKRALQREIVEREIDFERDPAMRDIKPVGDAAVGGGTAVGGKAALNKMLEKAADSVQGDNEALSYYKARSAYEANQKEQEQSQRRLLDIGLAGTIFILIAVVVVLFVTRG